MARLTKEEKQAIIRTINDFVSKDYNKRFEEASKAFVPSEEYKKLEVVVNTIKELAEKIFSLNSSFTSIYTNHVCGDSISVYKNSDGSVKVIYDKFIKVKEDEIEKIIGPRPNIFYDMTIIEDDLTIKSLSKDFNVDEYIKQYCKKFGVIV